MYSIAKASANERDTLFENTAAKKGVNAAIVEKDFWVVLTLDYLFRKSRWKDHLAFKGGTSLRDHHLAIVPRYVFEEAQRLREHTVSLGHLPLTCPICGKRMEREARGWICECKRFYMPTKVVKEILGQVTESQVATAATPQAEGAAEDGAEGVTEGGADAGTPIIIPASKNNHYGMKRRNANGLLVDSVVKEITFGDHQKKENCTMSIRWDDGDVDTLPTNFYRMGTSLYAKKGSKKKTKQLREVTRKPWETKTKP